MRILRIDSWQGEESGGAQAYVRTVSAELEDRGHPNRILSLTDATQERPRVGETRVRVATARVSRLGADLVDAPAVESSLRELVREFRPDLIHLHHFDSAFQTLVRVLRDVHAPVVFTAHDAELVCPISTLVRPGNIICEGGVRWRCLFTGCHVGAGGPYNLWQTAVLDRELAPRIRVYLCPSTALAVYLDRHGYRPAVYLPPFAEIPPAVVDAPLPERTADLAPTIGFLGRLEAYKGVFDLAEAMARVHEKLPSARLEIAGEGPQRAALESRIASLGLADATRFHGWVTGASKEDWFRGIDVLAFPSNTWENLGFVALEALARGRPVVGTNIGGIPEVVADGVTGRLVPIGDPPALAGALLDLLIDRAHSRALGLAGRAHVLSEFAPALHIDRLLAVYRTVLDGSPIPSLSSAETLGRAPGSSGRPTARGITA